MARFLTLVAAVLFAGSTFAQPLRVSDVFPLSDTRYGGVIGAPLLKTNGRDFFLFWMADQKIRATKLRDGEVRTGHVVFDDVHLDSILSHDPFDVVWTGEHFLLFAVRKTGPYTQDVFARTLDAEARPIAEEQTLLEDVYVHRAAVTGESILLVYRTSLGELRSLILTRDGVPTGAGATILPKVSDETPFAVAGSRSTFAFAVKTSAGITVTLLDGEGRTIVSRDVAVPSDWFGRIAVASNESGYLVAWCDPFLCSGATLDASGELGASVEIDRPEKGMFSLLAATWNGHGWTVAYSAHFTSSTVRIASLDTSGAPVSKEESAPGFHRPTLAALNGRVLTAWVPTQPPMLGTVVTDLPLASHQTRPVTFTATTQELLATTTSGLATLVVWKEKGDGRTSVRVGIRTGDGDWSERELLSDTEHPPISAVAASDARGFLVGIQYSNGPADLFLLDSLGRTEREIAPKMSALAVAWNGSHYAVIGEGAGVLVTNDGELSAPVPLPSSSNGISIASNGNAFLLTWQVADGALRARRLGHELRPGDDVDVLNVPAIDNLGVVFDGIDYIAAWSDSTGDSIARIPVKPGTAAQVKEIGRGIGAGGAIVNAREGIAIVGRTTDVSNVPVSRLTLLRPDFTVAQTLELDRGVRHTQRPHLEPHPDDGLAYIASSMQDDEPFHGTSHIMMALVRSSLPPLPTAPGRVIVQFGEDDTITAAWTAATGQVNGYRVEYRIDDGSWTELEGWFDYFDERVTIHRPPYGTRFAFRVRALNDAGAGPYSDVASIQPGRRRAVR